jgi:hypothetical protein
VNLGQLRTRLLRHFEVWYNFSIQPHLLDKNKWENKKNVCGIILDFKIVLLFDEGAEIFDTFLKC